MSDARIIETFREVSNYTVGNLQDKEPSCFNGCVSVEKYRITIERIDEDREVICARLEKLWRESDNHHDLQPLRAKAAKYRYEFTGQWGQDRKKR